MEGTGKQTVCNVNAAVMLNVYRAIESGLIPVTDIHQTGYPESCKPAIGFVVGRVMIAGRLQSIVVRDYRPSTVRTFLPWMDHTGHLVHQFQSLDEAKTRFRSAEYILNQPASVVVRVAKDDQDKDYYFINLYDLSGPVTAILSFWDSVFQPLAEEEEIGNEPLFRWESEGKRVYPDTLKSLSGYRGDVILLTDAHSRTIIDKANGVSYFVSNTAVLVNLYQTYGMNLETIRRARRQFLTQGLLPVEAFALSRR